MKAAGLIVEYNPFHNGHLLHLKKARETDEENIIIAVMSGDFVQRGEPAVINRWKRAEAALKNGIDIVVELPVFYSCQSAEIFAKGAVGILKELECSRIIFGSESSDIENLKKTAQLEESLEFKEKLKEYLGLGDSYPTAHSKAVKAVTGSEGSRTPNDILGVEYIKAVEYWKAEIEPLCVKREKSDYHSSETFEDIASATAVRKLLREGKDIKKFLPLESWEILQREYENKKTVSLEDFYPLIRYEVIRNRDILFSIQDMEKGYENRLYEAALLCSDFGSFFKSIESRRFTLGRTQRILIHILLGITEEMTKEVKKDVPFVRVLGFNSRGREYLSWLKKNKNRKIITSLKNIRETFSDEERKLIEFNEQASAIYKMVNFYEDVKIPLIFK